MIIRIDDVSPSTDMAELEDLVLEIQKSLRPEKIMMAVNILGKDNGEGSVYPKTPFKDREANFFYNIDSMLDIDTIPEASNIQLVSHGLLHLDHSKMPKATQEMSILSSCSYLDSRVFVPPFNRYTHITEAICVENRITLIKPQEGWRSLDYHALKVGDFDPSHDLWYLHPWRWTVELFREKVSGKVSGFVPSNNGRTSKFIKTGGVF